MRESLTKDELLNLIVKVFPNFDKGDKLAFLVDIPRKAEDDSKKWKERREIAKNWTDILKEGKDVIGLGDVSLFGYEAVSANNADLPDYAFKIDKDKIPDISSKLRNFERVDFKDLFKDYKIFIAMTQLSATAPLKNSAKVHGFRAATMPGFSSEMIPALKIDYEMVAKKVRYVKEKLDDAESAEVIFSVKGEEYRILFDLRYRKAHESSGRFPQKGTAGNLPSGEAYIVPYEGEYGESRTEGIIPVQIGKDIVFYKVKNNRALEVFGEGENVEIEREHLKREPAYGNIAELGFGVLYEFGLKPIGEILLDEKLGFHIAFGRSDHFGGQVGPKDFSSPEEVIHLDRIYIKEIQPDVLVKSLTLKFKDSEKILIENNKIKTGEQQR